MEQEKLIWKLQVLKKKEYALKNKGELQTLTEELKGMRSKIEGMDKELAVITEDIIKAEKASRDIDGILGKLNMQVEKAKENLYGAKGKSMKELMALQQAVMNNEVEIEKAETQYLEDTKRAEELKIESNEMKKAVKKLKVEYNSRVKVYKEKAKEVESLLSELRSRQEAIREQLSPAVIRLVHETERHFPQNPISYLQNGSCSECHISLPAVLERRIQERTQLCRCDNCGRIIINKQ